MWLEIDHLTYIPASILNLHIHFIKADNKQNKRCYDMLVYTPPNKALAFAVVWYNGQWHECYSKARTYKPFLGPIQAEVHVSNTTEEAQPDEPTAEDSTTEDEREPDTTFRYTPA